MDGIIKKWMSVSVPVCRSFSRHQAAAFLLHLACFKMSSHQKASTDELVQLHVMLPNSFASKLGVSMLHHHQPQGQSGLTRAEPSAISPQDKTSVSRSASCCQQRAFVK